nr:DUF2177 family protein [Alteromonas macleodii]
MKWLLCLEVNLSRGLWGGFLPSCMDVWCFVLAVVANRDKSLLYAGIDGALSRGWPVYGAYNLTAYSIIEGFTLFIMLIDWAWGTCLTSASAMAGWLGFQLVKGKSSE